MPKRARANGDGFSNKGLNSRVSACQLSRSSVPSSLPLEARPWQVRRACTPSTTTPSPGTQADHPSLEGSSCPIAFDAFQVMSKTFCPSLLASSSRHFDGEQG
eukprot:5439235-Amphidinium_carterae.1